MGPRTDSASSSTPSGACVRKKARWDFENSLRIERSPARTRFTSDVPSRSFSVAEMT
jgi:hypothetical protein